MLTNPRLTIHQQYIYHPPYTIDYISIFNIDPVGLNLMRDKIRVRNHDILRQNVDLPSETAEKSSFYERGRVEGRQSFAIPDLIQDPEVGPYIHKIIKHTPGFRV